MLQGMVMAEEWLKMISGLWFQHLGRCADRGDGKPRRGHVISLLALRHIPLTSLCPALYCMELPFSVFSTFWFLWVGLASERR